MKNKDFIFKIDSNISEKVLETYYDLKIEYSDDNFQTNGNGDFSIYLDESYLCLEMDISTKRISGFSGIYPLKKYKSIKVDPLVDKQKGVLTLCSKGEFIAGCGTRINFDCSQYYDLNKHLFIIGKYNLKQPYYQFCNNGYVQLDVNGILNSIMIENIDL